MKLNKFANLYSKPLGNHTLKIMKIYLEIYLKTWKNHGNIMEFRQSEKVGTLIYLLFNIGTYHDTARKGQFNIVSTVTASE